MVGRTCGGLLSLPSLQLYRDVIWNCQTFYVRSLLYALTIKPPHYDLTSAALRCLLSVCHDWLPTGSRLGWVTRLTDKVIQTSPCALPIDH